MTDLWLIYRCRQGDGEAFAILYERHRRSVFRTALCLVRSTALAEEIVQDAFITAFQQIGKLRTPAAFRTWLYRIVVSRATRMLRAEGGERRPLSLDLMHEGMVPTAPEPGLALDDREELAELRAAVLALEDELRLPVLLHYYSGLRVAEVGSVLAIPAGTVKSRLHTARRKLAQALVGKAPGAAVDPKELSV